MTAEEIVKAIEEFAPRTLQEPWDNCGFSVGDPGGRVRRALLALDCTESVMEEAVERGCDLIITHHPLIFGGIRSVTPRSSVGRMLEKAVRNNIVVYSAHTSMDKVLSGVSGRMADRLGLSGREPLDDAGFGIAGELPEPCGVREFAGRVKSVFGVEYIRMSEPVGGPISRVAVCGGSGRSFIGKAMEKGVQVYITGDITYHDFYCEPGFMVMDIGHYASEYDVVQLFSEILSEKFPTFTTLISGKNNNPIYYY